MEDVIALGVWRQKQPDPVTWTRSRNCSFFIVLVTESRCSKYAGSTPPPQLSRKWLLCKVPRQLFRKLVKVSLWGEKAVSLIGPEVLFSTPQVACPGCKWPAQAALLSLLFISKGKTGDAGCGAAGLRDLLEVSVCFNQQGYSLNRVHLSSSRTDRKAEVLYAQGRWLGSPGRATVEQADI